MLKKPSTYQDKHKQLFAIPKFNTINEFFYNKLSEIQYLNKLVWLVSGKLIMWIWADFRGCNQIEFRYNYWNATKITTINSLFIVNLAISLAYLLPYQMLQHND